MRNLFMVVLMAQSLSAQSIPEVRTAVTRALPILQRSASEFVTKRACVSCHHNILPILTLHLAQSRGFTIDPDVLGAVEEKSFRELRNPNALDDAVQAANLSDPTPNESYLSVEPGRGRGVPNRAVPSTHLSPLQRRWRRTPRRPVSPTHCSGGL